MTFPIQLISKNNLYLCAFQFSTLTEKVRGVQCPHIGGLDTTRPTIGVSGHYGHQWIDAPIYQICFMGSITLYMYFATNTFMIVIILYLVIYFTKKLQRFFLLLFRTLINISITITMYCEEGCNQKSLEASLPEQLNPSPKYPSIQVHVKLPGVLVQLASALHPPLSTAHSSTSATTHRGARYYTRKIMRSIPTYENHGT